MVYNFKGISYIETNREEENGRRRVINNHREKIEDYPFSDFKKGDVEGGRKREKNVD
jgi:hypothetical protein